MAPSPKNRVGITGSPVETQFQFCTSSGSRTAEVQYSVQMGSSITTNIINYNKLILTIMHYSSQLQLLYLCRNRNFV